MCSRTLSHAKKNKQMSSERAQDDIIPKGERSEIDGINNAGTSDEDTFPIVGIGASAGGLRAFQEFFSALPARPGMAFVLVQHLSPDHESALAQLVQAKTEMTVTQVADHPDVEPDRVYVIPPGKHLEIEDGHLQLVESRRDRGRPAAVDHFFRTLGDDQGARAVCVVLSGTGADGSIGLKAVKERGGLTMAQSPDDAEYDGMPRSAIGTGLVDVQGTAADLANKLVQIRRGPPASSRCPTRRRRSCPRTTTRPCRPSSRTSATRRRTTSPTTSGRRSCAASPGASRSPSSRTCRSTPPIFGTRTRRSRRCCATS